MGSKRISQDGMSGEKNSKLLTIAQVAEAANVSRATVTGWLDRRELPFIDLPGKGDGSHRFRRIHPKDFLAFQRRYHREPDSRGVDRYGDEADGGLSLIKRVSVDNYDGQAYISCAAAMSLTDGGQ